MSYRFMRLLLFFDLPRYTALERKQATRFRKDLVENGFIMLQESVYCKLALNVTAMDSVKAKVAKILPTKGSVMMLTVTEKQFENMDIYCENFKLEVAATDSRLLVI